MRIMIRYDEIGLKSDQVRKNFEDRLINNIKKKTNDKVFKENDRIFVGCDGDNLMGNVLKLRKTPGISSVSPCIETSSEPDKIQSELEEIIQDYEEEIENFALEVRRTGGHDYTSMELAEDLGQRVVDEFDLGVDLENPDLRVHIEVRNKNAYLFTEKFRCIGGLPIGIEGVSLLMLEDRASVVAGVFMMKRGCEIIPVTVDREEEELEEPIGLLKDYDPDLKLVNVDSFDPEEIEKVAKTLGCESVISGATNNDLKEGKSFEGFSISVLKPNCSMSDQEVLDKYNEFRF